MSGLLSVYFNQTKSVNLLLFFKRFTFKLICICVCLGINVHMYLGPQGVQKLISDTLEMEL